MDPDSIFAISAAGMELERKRVEVAALNLANANTVAAPGQTPFRPLRVIATTAVQTFSSAMAAGQAGIAALQPQFHIEPAAVEERKVHEPGHPLADAQGFVSYPAVDAATEMMSMMEASRAYEANVAALNMVRGMAQKALEIGGGQ
ncbi:MAG TPA: flagellar basal body rod protein FlgC [Ramlibacter sp.]|uniref:flagellar basal body rod protein FlgC n=1 Tax=Ramlibacter sp. TaxID=1917967 RepID=UPI002CD219C4|nr:flagellar basal body rod protein FlgC [Ramlibacter sp.]HVZ46125.1 flagellar basal body rod protein FlgC [Ramlibacter sp.]